MSRTLGVKKLRKHSKITGIDFKVGKVWNGSEHQISLYAPPHFHLIYKPKEDTYILIPLDVTVYNENNRWVVQFLPKPKLK